MTLKNTDLFNIEVINHQTIDNTTDDICESGVGSFYIKNDKQYIIYKVKNDDEETSVIVTIQKDCVTVKRSGAVSSVMVFDKTKKTNLKYNTMYGCIDTVVDTTKIVHAIDHNGGKLRLVYTLTMQGAKMYNDMIIQITPLK